ncbi:MAG: hypothetical protein ACJAT2_000806 [Bacteriovoracaceae bacterium]|jgi:hypothetical protein
MKELKESDLFEIDLSHLKDIDVFPFHLYVFNPSKKSYSLYLEANTPLTEQKLTFIQYILQRKGKLAISNGQKLTFLSHMEYQDEDIPSLIAPPTEEVESKGKPNIVIDFDFEDEFVAADKENDYSRLITQMKNEVSGFSQKMSHTISLARYLVENLCTEDNFTNRVVCLSYFLAKEIELKDTASLGDLIVASYFYHIGFTQLDLKHCTTASLIMGDRMGHENKKHLGLSQHLIRKSGVDINERCKKIINEHHERVDGNGYPNSKSKYNIEPLALVLGAASHLIEFSSGLIDGNKQMILPLIKLYEKGERKPGLEIEFGEHIIENLVNFVQKEIKTEAA